MLIKKLLGLYLARSSINRIGNNIKFYFTKLIEDKLG